MITAGPLERVKTKRTDGLHLACKTRIHLLQRAVHIIDLMREAIDVGAGLRERFFKTSDLVAAEEAGEAEFQKEYPYREHKDHQRKENEGNGRIHVCMISERCAFARFSKNGYGIGMPKTKKRIYLDHAAATPVDPTVVAAMHPFFISEYGNPGAIHQEGTHAREALDAARKSIATHISALPGEVIFTASATASANLAVLGTVRQWRKEHPGRVPTIIISSIEHAAVREPAFALAREGATLIELPVRADGIVDVPMLSSMITPDTALISVMYANNEIGTIQPLREIARILRGKRREFGVRTKEEVAYPLLHSDACQAVNFLDVSVLRLGIDLMTFSSAKCYGPKGIGVLYRRRGVPLEPVITGGGQEFGMWAGTENVPLAVGFAKAFDLVRKGAPRETNRLARMRDKLIHSLQKEFPDIYINGSRTERLPGNVSFTIPEADHENLVIMLDAEGIACSTKSACNETDAETSHVIEALRRAGGAPTYPASAIRMTFGKRNTMEDVRAVILAMRSIRVRMRPLIY